MAFNIPVRLGTRILTTFLLNEVYHCFSQGLVLTFAAEGGANIVDHNFGYSQSNFPTDAGDHNDLVFKV